MLVSTGVVRDSLGGLASSNNEASASFLGYISDIETNIDAYVDAPQGFADSLLRAIQIPATVEGRVDQKLTAYAGLLDVVALRGSSGSPTAQEYNSYSIDELVGSGAVSGVAESVNRALIKTSAITRSDDGSATVIVPVVTDGFRTRGEVLAAAIYARDQANVLLAKLDEGQLLFRTSILSDAYVQSLNNYDPLEGITSSVIRSALDLSFALPSERIKILDNESTLLEQCYELYGNIDDATLDYFILTNQLTGDNLLLMPRGSEVVYYV
jgi:hypothetical protein